VWKKKESEPETARPTTPPPPAPRPQSRPEPKPESMATIGPTVTIRGEVNGQENLRIQGRIEGRVALQGQDVTVGKSGRVQADIRARSIRIEGEVVGDLYGEQEIIIDASGQVSGNLVAPRVVLENGSRFKGSIDMEGAPQFTQAKAPQEKPGAGPGSGGSVDSAGATQQPAGPATSRPPGDPRARS
jgi:cytoskeletal protein CcmA (bactofilin family)